MKRLGIAMLLAVGTPDVLAETVTVTIMTADRTTLTGTLESPSVTLDTAVGPVTVAFARIQKVQVRGGAAWVVHLTDGQKVSGEVKSASWKLATSLGVVDIDPATLSSIAVKAIDGKPVEDPAGPVPGGEGPPPPKPVASDLKVLAEYETFGELAGRGLLSADGTTLYALDFKASRFLALETSSLRSRYEVPVPAGVRSLMLFPDGRQALCAGRNSLVVIDLATGEVKRSFDVEKEIWSALPLTEDIVLASGSLGLYAISISRQSLVRSRQEGGGLIVAVPGARRVFTSSHVLAIPDGLKKAEDLSLVADRTAVGASSFSAFTPDGRIAVCLSGEVCKLGRSHVALALPFAKVLPHTASVVLPASRRLLAFTSDRRMVAHSLETWEAGTAWSSGLYVWDALADEKRRALYLFANTQMGGRNQHSVGPGRWMKVELPE